MLIQKGSTGSQVSQLQRELVAAGLMKPGSVDGVFGSQTLAAVTQYQKKYGLAVDGKVGNQTWGKLMADGFSPIATTAKYPTLKQGASGPMVTELQKELLAAGCDPKGLDGDFGPNTLAAVKAYQGQHGLAVDGIVGPKTWAALKGDSFTPGTTPSTPTTPTPGTGPTTPTGKGATPAQVQKVLDTARSNLGYHEGAGNSNKFSQALGRPAEAWCADFVSYCAKQAGLKVNTPSAQGVANALKAQGLWKGKTNPQPGDAVTFRWDGSGGWADHVGLVEKVYTQNGKTYIQTIEGNSSDQVRRKTYLANDPVINGYGKLY